MANMLVNIRAAYRYDRYDDSDFGHSPNSKAKAALKRQMRRQDKNRWRKDHKVDQYL